MECTFSFPCLCTPFAMIQPVFELPGGSFHTYGINSPQKPLVAPLTLDQLTALRTTSFDTLVIPVYSASLSLFVLLVHAVWGCLKSKRNVTANPGLIKAAGGCVNYTFRFVRLIACLALLGLETRRLVLFQHFAGWYQDVLRFGLAGVYVYASILALISVSSSSTRVHTITKHLSFTLLTTWLVFVYRDIFPLITYHLRPIDAEYGSLLWTSIGILSLAAVVVPLCAPRIYEPVDPENPSTVLNPEQTASILSRLIFTFLDPLVYKANSGGVEHLPLDELPPLADYDEAKYLVTRNLERVQPYIAKKRHIFFGFLSIFRLEYTIMVLTTLLEVAMAFASPIGVNKLLQYIETGGEGATIRPWFWILWLLIGPVLGAIGSQYHSFLISGIAVRLGATINQLVFDHALRIRVKAETRLEVSSESTTAAATPENASVVEQPGSPENEDESANKHKQQEPSEAASEADTRVADEEPSGGNLIGKINNLVTSDAMSIGNGLDIYSIALYVPLQMLGSVFFLYSVLGWSAFVGILTTVAFFPIPGYLGNLMSGTQQARMEKTDARVQTVTETLGIIRMIKLFGWESKMKARIERARAEELRLLRRLKFLENLTGIANFALPFITTIVTFGTYSIIVKKELTASVVFSALVVFDMIRGQLWTLSGRLPVLIRAKVSLDRINSFLYSTELLDKFTSGSHISYNEEAIASRVIGIKNASFTWDADSDGTATPNRRNFVLRIDDELVFKNDQINLVVGPTGSGKTSLLMALLGEMHYIPQSPTSYYHLPRSGGVAYAAQESWVQSETIRDNILFGSEYDEVRYKKVIDQCGLKRDLELFEAGDLTEVGEKGLTLSGGQKARITLARAVYSKAEILLLDDVLAALDVHTAKWVVEQCFNGDLIRGRTVILVTHNIALASPIADFVVSLGRNGRISQQGSLSKVLAKDASLSAELKVEEKELVKADETIDDSNVPDGEIKLAQDGKLVVAEEIAVGRVGWAEVKLFFGSLGGKRWLLWWSAFAGNMLITPLMETFQVWYLGYWAHKYEELPSSEVSAPYYLSVYSVLIVISCTINTSGYLYYVLGAIRASKKIHERLISSVLGSTLRWLDTTPTSRVVNRCTQDIASVDDDIPNLFSQVAEVTTFMLARLVAVIIVAPAALIPGLLVGIFGLTLGRLYLKTQLAIKREMSNAQSPILSHFAAAIAGLVSIRAYGAQKAVKQEFFVRIDKYTRANRVYRDVTRWMSLRMESMGAIFTAGIAAYLVYGRGVTASNIGFAMNMAVGFCELIRFWIFASSRIEVQANSLERIQQYLEIDHEPAPTAAGVPPAYWPSSGNLSVETLSAKYSADGPTVLQDLSFNIRSGERVGIVGRTGSGKSSLTLALLRCILTEGRVYYDGIPTDSVNLDALRSNITIIPQVPELISGTLRQNLDPFEEQDDAVLNDCLRAAGLFSLQHHEDEARLTLDSAIASGGSNLSVGQRQIIALARAMVRKSKLLILDEATSAIDNETDNVIQESLRNELDKDVTLLTIAHRLQTIMDADKIMVLDAGRIAEFGEPKELLKDNESLLRALVDESSDKDHLYSMLKA
ncbi:hypothetical protein BXZ70DRAFT_1074090 [Cristinia sonorae]|uniref:P-loop containing nucleoside triphosphate hydrolase protein n=1 Tax=Cristinia sonorae TaxID=1940300 RepID=A0A8K0XJZ5_9AGAR|nr:hypothetical protein BXZ70DRAFT_1074090 [Cristinia sonorae]